MTTRPTLESRVDRLEQEDVYIYDLIKEETTAIRADISEVRTELSEVRTDLSAVSATVAEILRRLPEPA